MDHNSSTPPIGSNIQSSSSSGEQPSSPLERLDPQRLRDQAVASHLGPHALQGHWSPVPSNISINSPIRTPQSVQSPLPVSNQQRHSSGSVESLQQFTNQQFFSQNDVAFSPDFGQQQQNPRAQLIQSQSPSRIISTQIGSPHCASPSFSIQSANSSASQFVNPKAQQQTQYRMMTINGQTMYATVPTLAPPGTPTSAPPRVQYQIQSGSQFTYAQPPPQQEHQSQQWIAIQPQQMQFSGQPRIVTQPVQRNASHRFPQGYPHNHIQGTMVYTTNVPGSPHPQRITMRPQVVTTQAQQNIPQIPQTPGTPTTLANLPTPSTPVPQPGVIQPSGFYAPQGYPANYTQNGGYAQQRPQAPPSTQTPAVRQFVPANNAHGNPQAPPLAPNHYPNLPNINGGPQRLKGILPQAPSGHFGSHAPPQGVTKQAVDMRSPSLISPNQPVQLLAAAPIPSHNMSQMTPRPQQPPQHPMRLQPQFFYPESQNNVPPELCLAGCYFILAENPVGIELRILATMIRYYGGEIDVYNIRTSPDKATHVICDSASHIPQVFEQKNKRICTLAWVNDIIEKRKIEPPYKVCHLPCLATKNAALCDKVISATGFTDREISNIKYMVQMIGAKFVPYLSKHTTFLIAKTPNSPKVEKAARGFGNSIQVVNITWLCELYFGFTAPLSDVSNRRFSVIANASIEIGPVPLSKFNETAGRMMLAWQYPLTVTDEHLNRAKDAKAMVLNDDMLFMYPKYGKMFTNGVVPTDAQIKKSQAVLSANKKTPDIRVAFSGFQLQEQDHLSRKIQVLGVEVVDKVEKCDFLIAPHLLRTTNIFKAIAAGKDILSPLWVTASFNNLQITNTDDFLLHDVNTEKSYGCNLRATLLLSRRQPIFENLCFYVTPNVKPSRHELQAIIENGGGTIDKSKPTPFTLCKYFDEDRLYIIISSQCDLVFFQEFTEKNIPIFSEEFVFCAIMRHKIDTTNFFAINLAQQNPRTGSALSKAPVTPIQKNSIVSSSQVKA